MSRGSRWRKFPTIAAWAVAPALLACACYAASESSPSHAPAASLGLAALPPLVATTAGILVFARRGVALIVVSFCSAVPAYLLLPVSWLSCFYIDAGGVCDMIASIYGPAWLFGLFGGGAVVGSKLAAGAYHLLIPRSARRAVCTPSRLDTAGAPCPRRNTRVDRGVRWLGGVVGVVGVELMLEYAVIVDSIPAMLLYGLTAGAWLSAACVVLVLGPKSAARDEPGDSPAGGSEPP